MNSQKFKKVDKTKVDKYMKRMSNQLMHLSLWILDKTEIDETDAIISEIVGHTQAYKEYESEINKASDTIRRKYFYSPKIFYVWIRYASLIRDSKGVTLLDMQMELKKERQRIEDFYRPLIYKESHALKELYDKGKVHFILWLSCVDLGGSPVIWFRIHGSRDRDNTRRGRSRVNKTNWVF